MAIRAIGLITSVFNWTQDSRIATGGNGFNCNYVGDASSPVWSSNLFFSVPALATKAQIKAAAKLAIQNDLVTNNSYVFAADDTISII